MSQRLSNGNLKLFIGMDKVVGDRSNRSGISFDDQSCHSNVSVPFKRVSYD